jgi:hypothetical protein
MSRGVPASDHCEVLGCRPGANVSKKPLLDVIEGPSGCQCDLPCLLLVTLRTLRRRWRCCPCLYCSRTCLNQMASLGVVQQPPSSRLALTRAMMLSYAHPCSQRNSFSDPSCLRSLIEGANFTGWTPSLSRWKWCRVLLCVDIARADASRAHIFKDECTGSCKDHRMRFAGIQRLYHSMTAVEYVYILFSPNYKAWWRSG